MLILPPPFHLYELLYSLAATLLFLPNANTKPRPRPIQHPHQSSPPPSQWVTSKEALGLSSSTKRPTSCVMIAKVGLKKKVKEGEVEKEGLAEVETEFQEAYVELEAEVNEL